MPTTSEPMAHLSDEELIALAEVGKEQNHLTREQRALIHLDARREAQHALRSYRRNAIISFLVLLAGLIGGSLVGTARLDEARKAVVDSGNAVVVSACNRDFRTALSQRQSLYKQPQRAGQPVLSEKEKDKIIRQLTPLPDCRRVQGSLTDSPEKKVKTPEPLWEGKVGERGKLE